MFDMFIKQLVENSVSLDEEHPQVGYCMSIG